MKRNMCDRSVPGGKGYLLTPMGKRHEVYVCVITTDRRLWQHCIVSIIIMF